ncbi:MAG: response regulator transcription factor [Prevotella sp.]|nr:response regulator transcription factor [Prevotella sp.]MDY5665690.1 response regulator transcription factor [Alloprevotella sp.]
MMSQKILVVDDEPDLREILQCNLESAGYEVDTAESAEEALHILSPEHNLILLDVMLGGMSGYRMANKLRNELKLKTPIIFLTAKDTENDLLTGFSAGADDYISKPFSLHEVLARIKAVLRRTKEENKCSELKVGELTIDFAKKLVLCHDNDVKLSPKEFGIFSMLAKEPGRVFSRAEILAVVWHGETYVLDRTVDVHIARIRRKLGDESIHINNRQGYGYSFEL